MELEANAHDLHACRSSGTELRRLRNNLNCRSVVAGVAATVVAAAGDAIGHGPTVLRDHALERCEHQGRRPEHVEPTRRVAIVDIADNAACRAAAATAAQGTSCAWNGRRLGPNV